MKIDVDIIKIGEFVEFWLYRHNLKLKNRVSEIAEEEFQIADCMNELHRRILLERYPSELGEKETK